MASNIVQVSTNEANNSNRKLRNNLDEAKRKMADLQRIVEDTQNWWEGETTKAFVTSFEAGVNVFNRYLDKIQQHGDAMVNSVEKQHAHDQGLARNIVKY